MYGRIYTIVFARVAVTVIQDLFEVLVPADSVMVLHRVTITQDTEQGDAEDEQLYLSIRRITGAPTSGSGGTVATPQPIQAGDAAAGITAEVNNTTQLTGGTNSLIISEAFNIRAGYDHFPPPEQRIIISPSTRLLVELETAPIDSVTFSGTMVVEEIGG